MKLGLVVDRMSRKISGLIQQVCAPSESTTPGPAIDAFELEPRILYSAAPIPLDAIEPQDINDTWGDLPIPSDLEPSETGHDLVTQLALPEVPSVENAAAESASDIVFIDSNVADWQSIASELEDSATVFVLQSEQDGLEQITNALSDQQSVKSIHIISHGSAGQVQLGSTSLSNQNLSAYTSEIVGWSNSLTSDADILFYGCDLAATEEGEELLESIGVLTGSDVAASDDLTGHDSLGGNWELEFVRGDLESPIIVSENLQRTWQSALAIAPSDGSEALWFATQGNGTAGGVSFDDLQITQLGGSLTFEPGGTSGTIEATGFSNTEDIHGIHFVESQTLTVGDTTLQRGDVLLVFGKNANIGGVDYDRDDVLLYRPTSLSDYSTGTYSMFLDGVGAGSNLHAISLVESDITVGGYDLNQGDLLIANSGGSDDKNIYVVGVNQTSFGATATTDFDTKVELIAGDASGNLDLNHKIEGLDIIEETTLIGDRTLNAGTILVSIDTDGSQDIQGSVSGSGRDIFALEVNTSEQNGGTDVTATQFFDGSDVGLTTNNEQLRAFSLIRAIPSTDHSVTVDTTDDIVDGDTSSITTLLSNRGTDGKISLREAIEAANNTTNDGSTPDQILFDLAINDSGHVYYQDDGIANSLSNVVATTLNDASITDFDPDYPYASFSWFRFDLDNSLPGLQITDAVEIDGFSQAGSSTNSLNIGQNSTLRIELTNLTSNANDGGADDKVGLTFNANADGSTVRGLNINEFGSHGILLEAGADNITIQGNYLGTDITGTVDRGNDGAGIEIRSNNNQVGGSNLSDRNVVSGNDGDGIAFISTAALSANVVENNYLGVDATGLQGLGNSEIGIELQEIDGVKIHQNVVSGNTFDGIRFASGFDATDASLTANLIGVGADGTTSVSNSGSGIRIGSDTATAISIGTAVSGQGNVIASNAFHGVVLDGDSVSGTTLYGNFIGTDLTATLLLGNQVDGIYAANSAFDNIIGGIASGQANVIANNTGRGVNLTGLGGTSNNDGNTIRGNQIYGNGNLGIDLGNDGVTANDFAPTVDADSGANLLQNFPDLYTATYDGTNLIVTGRLTGQALRSYDVDFYVSNSEHSSGHGQAEFYLDSFSESTPLDGRRDFTATLTPAVALTEGMFLTATSTHSDGSTSEFSANLQIVNQAPSFTFVPTTLSLAENADTTSATKIGDISISDDGFGTNNLTISGADQSSFSLVGTEVFLNAGVNLDFETKEQFDIRIDLDDPTLGSTNEQEELFTLNVNDVNEAPSIQNNGLTITRGATVTLGSNNLSSTDLDAGDPDANLQYTVSTVTSGRFELTTNLGVEVFNFSQAQIDAGEVIFIHDDSVTAPSYEVTVSDGTLSDGPQAATVFFGNNFTPTATLIADATVDEDANDIFLNLHSVFNDVEDSDADLVYSVESNSNPSLFTSTNISATGYLTLDFADNQNGNSDLVIRATDTGGRFIERTSRIFVNPINDDPFIATSLPSVNVTEDAPNQTLDLADYFDDVDILTNADSLTYSIGIDSNPGLVATSITGDTLTLSFLPDQNGSTTLEVIATDVAGQSIAQVLNVNVSPENDAPTVISPVDHWSADEDATQTRIDLNSVFDDIDDSTLFYSIVSNDNPTLLTASIETDELTLDYEADQNGIANILVRATDAAGDFVEHNIEVTVTPVNDAPTVTDKDFTVGNRGEVSGNLLSDATDTEGDPISVRIVTGPTNGTIEVRPNGEFTYTPEPGFSGTESIEFVAEDASGQSRVARALIEVENAVSIAEPDAPTTTVDGEEENFEGVLFPTTEKEVADDRADEQPRTTSRIRESSEVFTTIISANSETKQTSSRAIANSIALPVFSAPAEYSPTSFTESITHSVNSNLSFTTEMMTSLAVFGDQIEEATNSINYAFVNSIVSFSGFSLIGATWFLRGGALLASMMANVPAWRIIDPLVVLRYANDNDEGDESLHDIVEGNSPNIDE